MLLRFDEYQQRCLYDPEHGFYETDHGAGRRSGDFLTSVEVGPLFGLVLARWAQQIWERCGSPDDFTIVDVGCGRGALLAALRRSDEPVCRVARFVGVDHSAALRRRAVDLLGDGVEVRSAGVLEPIEHGVVIANELLDNLPTRILEFDGRHWREVMVRIGEEAVEELGAAVQLPPWVTGFPQQPAPGWRLPLIERARDWVDSTLAAIGSGALLAIDYGAPATLELVDHPWLRTYAQHRRAADPYANPMGTDITIDVPFDQLQPADSLMRQAELLTQLGIDELVEDGRRRWAAARGRFELAAVEGRSRSTEAQALTDLDGLGAFWCALWQHGVQPDAHRETAGLAD